VLADTVLELTNAELVLSDDVLAGAVMELADAVLVGTNAVLVGTNDVLDVAATSSSGGDFNFPLVSGPVLPLTRRLDVNVFLRLPLTLCVVLLPPRDARIATTVSCSKSMSLFCPYVIPAAAGPYDAPEPYNPYESDGESYDDLIASLSSPYHCSGAGVGVPVGCTGGLAAGFRSSMEAGFRSS
jgi:hypothetical protein